MNMATACIFRELPQRLQKWNLSECVAEQNNKLRLEANRSKQALVQATIAELDQRQKELDMLVKRTKDFELDPKALESTEEDEISMYYVTCGHEIHSRTAIRHMEKCFSKYESQASFGSIFKTRLKQRSTGNPMPPLVPQ